MLVLTLIKQRIEGNLRDESYEKILRKSQPSVMLRKFRFRQKNGFLLKITMCKSKQEKNQ